MTVVATAGHVDHGKSTLVQALTGIDPDRWAEEKERGMTIDLGFATAVLPSGRRAEFVDVPGHRRFLKNMLSGVGSASACVLVVAATEGWKAQSEEHLRILETLGSTHGIIAMTKVALLDPADVGEALEDVRQRVEGTFLDGAEIVCTDLPAGIGLDSLVASLDRLLDSVPEAVDTGRPRLWVDRSFAIRGAGCVLTGTLTGGCLAIGDEVVVEPGGSSGRVKSLQVNHQAVSEAGPGHRVAVNVSGVSHHSVRRGQALVRPGQWHVAPAVDASVRVLPALDFAVGQRGAFTISVGTGDHPVRLRTVGGRGAVEPGAEGFVRISFSDGVGLPLLPGDRYVLRELGRGVLVGGGAVLDVDPVLSARQAAPSLSVQRVVDERGWIAATQLERLTGARWEPTVGQWVVAKAVLEDTRNRLRRAADAAGGRGVPTATLGAVEREILESGVDGLVVRDGRMMAASYMTDEVSNEERRVLAGLEAAPFSPPEPPLSDRGILRALERRSLAFESDGVWFPSRAVPDAVGLLRPLLERSPAGISVSEARQALGTTRKYAVPLMKYLDSRAVTRRQGDLRVAGPRMGDYG